MQHLFESFKNQSNEHSVWNYFVRGKTNKNESKCTKCGKIIICSGGSTSGMHTHLKALHSIILRKREPVLSNEDLNIVTCSIANSAKKPKNSITEYFDSNTDNSLPAVLSRLVSCDGISFNRISKSIDIRLGLTSRGFSDIPRSVATISESVKKYGENIKLKITRELDAAKRAENQKFSLTFDEWTSVRNRRYLNLNIHSADTYWNLGLCRIHGTMPAEKCIEIIDTKLNMFGISLKSDVVSITTDGGSVMQKVGRIISVDHQLCLAHGIQLAIIDVLYKTRRLQYETKIVEDNYESVENDDPVSDDDYDQLCFQIGKDFCEEQIDLTFNEHIEPLIVKVRRAVRIFRQSPTKNDMYLQKYVKEEHGKELKLILDCRTRWNSLLLMLERFYKLKNSIQKALIDVKADIVFSKEDFDSIFRIITALTPVKLAVESLYCQDTDLYKADIAFEFMFDELSKQRNFLSNDLKLALKRRILERRFKYADLFSFLRDPKNIYNAREDYDIFNLTSKTTLLSQIVFLLERLCTLSTNLNESITDVLEITNSEVIVGKEKIEMSLKEVLQQKIKERSESTQSNASEKKKSKQDLLKVIRTEVKYYEEEGTKGKYLSIIEYYLKTVRPTSVESERAFSAAGIFLTKIRSMLSDDSLNNLSFLKSYFSKQK